MMAPELTTRQSTPGAARKGMSMYIGIGTVVLIVIIVLVILMLRRR
jgi:Tfp pilus assembly protein PilN